MTYLQRSHFLSGFNLNESLYPPGLKQPRHTHRFASFSFVLAGGYIENYGRKAPARRASTIVFHPPGESHAVDFQDGTRILSVEINFEKLASIREQSIVFDASASHRTATIAYLGQRLYHEFQQIDEFSKLAIEGLILELLAEASRSKIGAREKTIPRWLTRAKDFLSENFTESLTVEELSKIADVHPVHLARVFREKFGCTVGDYLRRRRVEFAAEQISKTRTPLCEIAQAAGFADQSHLNKIFKNAFGLTPAEYRKLNGSR